MAIALNGGHVARALDFYNKPGKYFIIGGTTPWESESAPTTPNPTDFKLVDVVGLKKVDNTHLVIPDPNGTIKYRDTSWKIVPESISTLVTSSGVTINSTAVPVASVEGLNVGSKVRIADTYEGKITSISGLILTLDTAAPVAISAGSKVLGGAAVEGAKYVYVDCYLEYNKFPLITYRQIGLCTGVTPDEDILLSEAYVSSYPQYSVYTSLGILEILDNRVPSTRDSSQRELLSLIIEF